MLLYQLSIGSGVADIFRERRERKFVNYHNITPADLLEAWIPAVGEEVRWGRAQFRDLAPVTEFAIADSAFNERELQAAGYRSTTTVPLLIDLDGFSGSPDPAVAGRLAAQKERGGADLLFVGKVSPHKGQHDLVKALAAYRRLYDPQARLHLVGGAISDEYRSRPSNGSPPSWISLDAVDIAGSVTHEELIAYYDAADAFVCLSNHEGFCVPLLEAMYHRLAHRGLHQHRGPRDGAGSRADPAQQGAGAGGGGHRPGDPRSQAPIDADRGGGGTGPHLRPPPGKGRVRHRPRRRPSPRDVVSHGVTAVPMRVTFVVPRYGIGIIGGAESAARAFAEHLVAHKGWEVDVLTSCAEDFVTWADVFSPGEEWINGVRVRRFAASAGRDPSFHPFSASLLADPAGASLDQAERWIDLQGPVIPDLADAAAGADADALVFYPYLYYPTVRVIGRVRTPTILHPAAHDEPALHLPVFPRVFEAADGLVLQTTAERDLVQRTFPVATHHQLLVGLGVDDPDEIAVDRHVGHPAGGDPYLVCLGRVDRHKGTGLLASLFGAYKQRHPGGLSPDSGRPGGRGTRGAPGHRRGGSGVRTGEVGAPRRGGGAGVALSVGGILAGGRRSVERPHPGVGHRGVCRHRRALPAIGRWTEFRRVR